MMGLLLWRFVVVGLMLWVGFGLEGCRGGCGMGDGFLMGDWVVGFVMIVGSVVADSAENS